MFSSRLLPKACAAATFIAMSGITFADLVIEQKMESPAQSGPMTLSIKGAKMRTDVGKDTTSIMDIESGKILTLMHGQKMSMEMPMPKPGELKAPDGTPLPKPKITHTGEKEKVAGHDCEIVTMEVAGAKTKMWVAKNYPNYDKIKKEMEAFNKASSATGEDIDFGGMVIKTEVEVLGTKATTTLVSVKETKLEDTLFKAPTGYTALPTAPAIPTPGQ